MKTLPSYLSTLHKRNRLTKEEYNTMRPKNGELARAHGLPKINKECSSIPKFRPIGDTSGTPHYSAGKFLTNLLNALAMNGFKLKDSFDAVNKIKNILLHLFDDGYNYLSFDVESLFTNVPIKRTMDIILKRIYIDKFISTKLKKRSMKKLLLDTCTKTAFTFNGVIYEQKDGVCMGSSLGPLLANVIMTDHEEKVIKPLINDNTIKFYARYVDDTLFVIKRENVRRIQNLLNNFNPILRFTVDLFQNEVPHFLDLELSPDGISILERTQTPAYTHFSRLVFSQVFYIRRHLGNVKEKPARKTCFSREMMRLALRIYLVKFC